MATHKAATAVTIAPVQEKSGLAEYVDRYWKLGLLVAVVITGAILFLKHKASTQRLEDDLSWDKVLAVTTEDPMSRDLSGSAADLGAVESQIRGKQAGAWALFLGATNAAEQQEPDEARKALAELRAQYPNHSLVTQKLSYPGTEAPQTAADALQARVEALSTWKVAHPGLFANPELPADAPRVRVQTDQGDIVLGLYSTLAPQHVENFLKHVREGFYNGTRFHRVIPGFMIQSGDPNTISGEADTWGLGGPGYKVPHEDNDLKHFAGVLAAAKMGGDKESSGSQFYITVAPTHQLDGDYVVFGKVLEGMPTAHAIESTPIDPTTRDRPVTPPVIRSMELIGG